MEFKHKKSLGQNFLKNPQVLQKIVDSVVVKENDLVIEVGPGQGSLTKYLVNYKCDILAFEIDLRVKDYLDKIAYDKLTVVYQDILQVDFSNYDLTKYDKIHVIANIPYYITTPIIEKIIDSKLGECDLTLMVQKEVAERFCAFPGNNEYGAFTVYLSYYYDRQKIIDVPAKDFEPAPKVDSAVVKLTRKNIGKKVSNELEFFNFVKECFQFKRKNIRNNLKKYDLNKIGMVLKNYGHDLNNRAEDFSVLEFIDLYNILKN